jgi:hypothetical protein
MPEYDLQLAEELAIVAGSVPQTELAPVAHDRMRLYLAMLSIELSLKAMLERAGMPVQHIRNRGHRIRDLLSDIDRCTIEVTPMAGVVCRTSASRLRSVAISTQIESGTVGQLIEGLGGNVSNYPNQIRYGGHLRHYNASLVADAAGQIIAFAKAHWSSIQAQPGGHSQS